MKLTDVTFIFENCDYITINGCYIGDFVIDDIKTSIERIASNCIEEMVEHELIKLLTDETYEKEIAETFFTPEDVRKMSHKEVRENYKQIMDSMRLWT